VLISHRFQLFLEIGRQLGRRPGGIHRGIVEAVNAHEKLKHSEEIGRDLVEKYQIFLEDAKKAYAALQAENAELLKALKLAHGQIGSKCDGTCSMAKAIARAEGK